MDPTPSGTDSLNDIFAPPVFDFDQWYLEELSRPLHIPFLSSFVSLNSPSFTSTQFLQAVGPPSTPAPKVTLKGLKESAPNIHKIVSLAKNQLVGLAFTTEGGAWIEDIMRSGSLTAEVLYETWSTYVQHQEVLPAEEQELPEDGYLKMDNSLVKLVSYYYSQHTMQKLRDLGTRRSPVRPNQGQNRRREIHSIIATTGLIDATTGLIDATTSLRRWLWPFQGTL